MAETGQPYYATIKMAPGIPEAINSIFNAIFNCSFAAAFCQKAIATPNIFLLT